MKFKMNDVDFEIKEVSQEEYKEYRINEDKATKCETTDTSKGIYFGATHVYKNIIFLDKELPKDRKQKTLIHELAHCYIGEYVTHQEKTYDEEMVADICANSYGLIKKIVEDYFK